MPLPYSVEEVRARMLSAWKGVQSLHAQAREKAYKTSRPDSPQNAPRFLECEDVERILPYHYEAWWQQPGYWRHDREVPSHPRTMAHGLLSYRVMGDAWWVKKDESVVLQGTVTEAQRGPHAQGESLISGRPYLSASDNRFLWAWLNPQLWAASLSLVVLDGGDLDDAFHDDQVAHVVAGNWLTNRAPLADQQQWVLIDWDREPEVLDYTNICQLWVDMRTGFCRRLTGEGANGRRWDIILDTLEINGPAGIPCTVFQP